MKETWFSPGETHFSTSPIPEKMGNIQQLQQDIHFAQIYVGQNISKEKAKVNRKSQKGMNRLCELAWRSGVNNTQNPFYTNDMST